MTPTFDFLIPAHNAQTTVGDTLASLRAQTVVTWRAIVVDDGSTDQTSQVVAALADPRITLIHQPPTGVAAARNRAFEASTADLVSFLDADDTVTPVFLETMIPAIAGHDIAACAYRYARPDLQPTDWVVCPGPQDHHLNRLAELNPYSIGGLVFRRPSLRRLIPGHEPLFGLSSRHEDWELLLRLAAAGAAWAPVIPEPLFTYRLRASSRTTDLRAMWLHGLDLIDRHHTMHVDAGPVRAEVAAAQRRWSTRSLARAISCDDRVLTRDITARLGPLTPADEGTLAGALRWAIRREVIAGSIVEPARADLVERLAAASIDLPLASRIAIRSIDPSVYWSRIARAVAARLAPEQKLVVFGLGRNGQEFLKHARELGIVHGFIDDAPPVAVDLLRIALDDLGPEHVVLVTPDEREHVVRKLARTRAGAVWLPEQMLDEPAERHSAGLHAADQWMARPIPSAAA